MERVDAMRPGRMGVQLVSRVSTINFSFEKLIEGVLFVIADVHAEILDCHTSSGIILDHELGGLYANVLRGC